MTRDPYNDRVMDVLCVLLGCISGIKKKKLKILGVSSPKTRYVVDVLILVNYSKNFNLKIPVNGVILDTRWDSLSRVIVKIKIKTNRFQIA